jgi:translation elongation factor EF-G
MVDEVEEWREKLIETAVEQDDDLMEAYLEGEEPPLDDIKRCIRERHAQAGLSSRPTAARRSKTRACS